MKKVDFLNDQRLILVEQGSQAKDPGLMMKEAEKYGWKLLQVTTNPKMLRALNPVGAILNQTKNSQIYKMITANRIPFVRVGSFPGFYAKGMPSVSVDFPECGAMAAKFYSERGFKYLAFIGNEPWGDSKEVFQSFKATGEALGCRNYLFRLRSSSISQDTNLSAEDWVSSEHDKMMKWIKALPKPVGLLTYNDLFASRLALFLISTGIRVPDDVSIIGIGNDEFRCETSLIPISSIEHNWAQMWKSSFKLLHDQMIEGEFKSENILIKPKLIFERSSTDIMPIHKPIVADALKYIRENFNRPISTNDVLSIVDSSRSTLERQFKEDIGRSIHDEIRCRRIELAERLLCNTTQSISTISAKVGFNSRNHFYRVFQSAHGCTPASFRKSQIDKAQKVQ